MIQRFNPLHCGAVVASRGAGQAIGPSPPVSIPFIAGQWSLRGRGGSGSGVEVVFQSPSLRGSGRFIQMDRAGWTPPPVFQSPSLRGSGRFGPGSVPAPRATAWFQSPSLRGSGRFAFGRWLPDSGTACFNPLHCGAVVASSLSSLYESLMKYVSIPFIAGQWSLPDAPQAAAARALAFQSPSLRGSGRFRRAMERADLRVYRFQSPSLRGSGRFALTRAIPALAPERFNPLHCGAVVASSRVAPRASARNSRVSIPFIAGQWSLHQLLAGRSRCGHRFNPLHCGAVVASR